MNVKSHTSADINSNHFLVIRVGMKIKRAPKKGESCRKENDFIWKSCGNKKGERNNTRIFRKGGGDTPECRQRVVKVEVNYPESNRNSNAM